MSTYGPLIVLSLAFALILGVQVFYTLYLGYNRAPQSKDPQSKDSTSNDPKPIVIPDEPTP